ncbi:hypothetical protein SAMN04488581_0405 [Mycolicibacterium neoaurum]|uniref:hypothetical protein n=1 Tax=Mycolicibacterium neoaurum TaxID=1795 RepID=UPI00055F29CF|nr:hypothetical protein [Mycolicibacterium neoaurum]SDC26081.1 hypothetical protein SAMN04488581_0405 [Mycolicibacterium neoaurum]
MPRYVDAEDDGPDFAEVRPGIYASLLPWAQWEYARSGDPRWRRGHSDGVGGWCGGGQGCDHGDPPPRPESSQKQLLDALEAGEPVVVPTWIARGRRWDEPSSSWTAPVFELPWGREVHHVRVTADDTVRPAATD